MIRFGTGILTLLTLVLSANAAEKSLQLKNLPAAVQKTVQEQAKGAEIKNISRETEKGITQYEVETMVGGKHRDFNVDTIGVLVVVEEETTLDAIPAAAQAAIEKRVAGGKLGMVETLINGNITMYEAAYTVRNGKMGGILVKADGSPAKD